MTTLLNDVTASVVIEPLPSAPTGYEWFNIDENEYTLRDNYGRMCVDILLRKAYTMRPPVEEQMTWEQWSAHNKPYDWLRTKFAVSYRTYLNDTMGHDPILVNNGGKRINIRSGSALSDIAQGFWQLRVSANGNVQTYGTYMDTRMFVDFAGSINIPFHNYVNEIFINTASNALSVGSLVMSSDALHQENNAINSRHKDVIQHINDVPANLASPYDDASWSMKDYNHWLHSDYNINTSTVGILKWLQHNGLFYVDYLSVNTTQYSTYLPRVEYTKTNGNTIPMFILNYSFVNKIMTPSATITVHGHNSLIASIAKEFGLIDAT